MESELSGEGLRSAAAAGAAGGEFLVSFQKKLPVIPETVQVSCPTVPTVVRFK